MVKYSVQSTRKDQKKINIWVIISVVMILGSIIMFIVNENMPTNAYLKNLSVARAIIAEKAIEDGKYYTRFIVNSNVDNTITVATDDSWYEVKESYFNNSKIFDETGVLVGSYDVFKKQLFGKGQKFQKNVGAIEDVYDSYEAAKNANPIKKYNGSATLKKKKTISNGTNFFVLDAEQRTLNIEVSKEVFDKYQVNQKVECDFEALGEFVKILGVR